MEHEFFQLYKDMSLVQQQEISDHAYTYSNFQATQDNVLNQH